MQIDIVTIFPEMLQPVLGASILKRAQESGRLKFRVHDLRRYTHDKHRSVDDRPYGGGPGMVMKPEPIFEALQDIKKRFCGSHEDSACQTVLMSPEGEKLSSSAAQELALFRHLIVLCGHYEGVDERVKALMVDRMVSIGDYVLTGGELPAMVAIDALARFIPGVIGHEQATSEESFMDGQLEYPQYTRPPVFRGASVPEILLSGDHGRVAAWRRRQRAARTKKLRPDLLIEQKNGHAKKRG